MEFKRGSKDIQEIRAKFEQWAQTEGVNLTQCGGGVYSSGTTRKLWGCWKRAVEFATTPSVAEVAQSDHNAIWRGKWS